MMKWMFGFGLLSLLLLASLWVDFSLEPPTPPEAPLSGKTINVLLSRQLGAGSFEQQYPFQNLELVPLNEPISVRSGASRSDLTERFSALPDQQLRFEVEGQSIVVQSGGNRYRLGPAVQLEGSVPESINRVRFRVNSSARADNRRPEYPGSLWITLRGGQMLLVNTVDFQDYLKRVLPSEVPPSFHPEALKAQAVAARTYAYRRQLEDSFWKQFGADVDDSVSEQVYNNQPTNPLTDSAVNQTRNEVLTFASQPLQTFFFSTSPGSTASIQEVWPEKSAVPYLVARQQTNPSEVSIANEAQALEFFKLRDPSGFYDAASPLWRWKVRLSRIELEAILAKTLPALARSSPQLIGNPEGSFAPDAPEFKLGTLRSLEVRQRATGGFIVELEIISSTGRYTVRRESSVRNLIRPNKAFAGGEDVLLERFIGEPRLNFPALPSAAFAMEAERDSKGNLVAIAFWGGGFGHGVGMSQFGSDGLGQRGKSYAEILEHFYPGAKLEVMGEK